MNDAGSRPIVLLPLQWPATLVCLSLALAIWFVFGQAAHHDFINFDDDVYVYANPTVKQGFTLEGIQWAFTQRHGNNWHPLTSLSHMMDCEAYGISPGGHHLTNVVLHGATAVVLFLVLVSLTGAFWPSAFVAAVFAIHPLRVESVAWVAERKDVLSGLFFALTLGAYGRYVRRLKTCDRALATRPSMTRPWGSGDYWLVLGAFTLGLMCKPMLVTLPLVLLLLDY